MLTWYLAVYSRCPRGKVTVILVQASCRLFVDCISTYLSIHLLGHQSFFFLLLQCHTIIQITLTYTSPSILAQCHNSSFQYLSHSPPKQHHSTEEKASSSRSILPISQCMERSRRDQQDPLQHPFELTAIESKLQHALEEADVNERASRLKRMGHSPSCPQGAPCKYPP